MLNQSNQPINVLVGFQAFLGIHLVSTNITFILQFQMLGLNVVSQSRHSGCFILALWAGNCCTLVYVFNMASKNILDGERFLTKVTLVSDSFMFCIPVPSQMTSLCRTIGTLVTRELWLLSSMYSFHVLPQVASSIASTPRELDFIAAKLTRQQCHFSSPFALALDSPNTNPSWLTPTFSPSAFPPPPLQKYFWMFHTNSTNSKHRCQVMLVVCSKEPPSNCQSLTFQADKILLHLKGFPPLCLLMWLCKLLNEVQAKLQWLHLKACLHVFHDVHS